MRTNDSGDGAGMARTSRRNWLTSASGNDLARDVDRWQVGVRLVLVALFVMMLPAAAVIGVDGRDGRPGQGAKPIP